VESFHHDGFLITGIQPDEVNWRAAATPRTARARSATAGGRTT
jgi:hypothetical protein